MFRLKFHKWGWINTERKHSHRVSLCKQIRKRASHTQFEEGWEELFLPSHCDQVVQDPRMQAFYSVSPYYVFCKSLEIKMSPYFSPFLFERKLMFFRKQPIVLSQVPVPSLEITAMMWSKVISSHLLFFKNMKQEISTLCMEGEWNSRLCRESAQGLHTHWDLTSNSEVTLTHFSFLTQGKLINSHSVLRTE